MRRRTRTWNIRVPLSILLRTSLPQKCLTECSEVAVTGGEEESDMSNIYDICQVSVFYCSHVSLGRDNLLGPDRISS